MRFFTCLLHASLLSLSLCSFAKEESPRDEEKRPSFMSLDITKFKKEMRVASNKKNVHKKKSEIDNLPEEMIKGIKSIKSKHISYTATKRQLVTNKVKKQARNENKKSIERKRNKVAEIMEELPEEMRKGIQSVKNPVSAV
ncbi:uncharacterized protein LOC116287090 [Actinia tenebrosa]|uniref:Uncharacterized protein LOC116287090 n=1 Tax=Actinia tenebrosa TaxID=6105 RepID=A0A6P8HA37_ACTTE|nr:uncharacterized protein LOC116287090 [Actinia tenebrosa]